MKSISKTDYVIYRECHKNAWYKIHKPDIYYASELSDFEKNIIETGNEIDVLAGKPHYFYYRSLQLIIELGSYKFDYLDNLRYH